MPCLFFALAPNSGLRPSLWAGTLNVIVSLNVMGMMLHKRCLEVTCLGVGILRSSPFSSLPQWQFIVAGCPQFSLHSCTVTCGH